MPLGANHYRLKSIGWERCGHGLTSRPLEASDDGFLDDLLSLFGYPSGSGLSLVDGSLRMRCCSTNFSCKRPTWKLPPFWCVAALVAAVAVSPLEAGLPDFEDTPNFRSSREVGRKRIRLTNKTNVRKRFGVDPSGQPIPKRWKADTLEDVAFRSRSRGSFVLQLGYLTLVSPRELAEHQVAQSHASRGSACRVLFQ